MSLNLYNSQTKQLTPLAGNARNNVVGATSVANGVAGLVPAPLIADRDKFLKGDGTWAAAGGSGGASSAEDVSYDNTTSELEAENVQDALDEIDDQVDTNTSGIQALTQQANAMLNILGAKNLLPNNAVSQTISGVTFTVNSDGSVTANGTATSQISLVLAETNFEANKYKLSGVPNGGADDTYFILFYSPSNNAWHDPCYGAERLITTTYSDDMLQIIIRSGQIVNNIVFKPMIRLASIQDDTYEPYAKTNRDLTFENQALMNLAYTRYVNIEAVNIETVLASYSRDSNFIITFTNNGTTGDLVNATDKHLFIIRHTCGTDSNMIIEEAFAVGSEQIAMRTWQWWSNSYSEWFVKANKPTYKSATLAAGSTTVTFTGIPTSGNYIVSFYTSNGANYTSINTATAGQAVLTFDKQSTAITVYCEIKGV